MPSSKMILESMRNSSLILPLWDLSPPLNMLSSSCCMSLSEMLMSFLRLWAHKTPIVFAGVDK
eukprot:1649471-Rhodomonas_salina.1